ncbi:MAG: hypothetical protein D6698_00055, partial [Gammaproteobacteria bacterium]
MKLEMRFFGGLKLSRGDGRLLDFNSEKGKALLCYLAVTGQIHSRAALAGLLWPESPEENARASLRRTLTGIRKIAPDSLIATRQTVGINPDTPILVDVAQFEEQAADKMNKDRLQKAAVLYEGDFLSQFFLPDAPVFERWVLGQRARLREMALETIQSLAAHFAEAREFETAVSYTRQLLDIEPWHESSHRELIRLLALSGQRSAALKQYETCSQILADELGVPPAADTTSLFEQIRDETLGAGNGNESLTADNNRQGLPDSPTRLLHNLPAAATPFVGREAELDSLSTLVADPQVRIITITGPGGMGKTRLALEAAGREFGLPSHFPDGVYFVSLAPLESADDLVASLAAAIGFQFQGSGEESEQLLNYLRQKRMLLIMDNFEHILEGRTLLAEISSRSAGITLLITSRERLQMRGEQLFPIQGLALAQTPAATTESPAASLFLQAARRSVMPDFQLLKGDGEHLQRICQLVEGMPLGLELAASWAGSLPLSEIAAEIEQSMKFLATEHHDVPQRHKSIAAALDASWRRLTSEQQRTFQELTIFNGGFTRETAVTVADASLPLLIILANQSWLSYDRQRDRYHIHELLRQYGAGKLHADPAHEREVRKKHSTFFCNYLHERESDWRRPRQLDVVREVRVEIDNIQRAWRWATAEGNSHLLAQGLDSLCNFYYREGRLMDAQNACRLAAEGLARIVAQQEAEDAACLVVWSRVLTWESNFAPDSERKENLLAQSQHVLDRAVQAGWDTTAEQANLFLYKSFAASDTDLEVSKRLANLGLELFRHLGDKIGETDALNVVGTNHLFQGDFDQAQGCLNDSL